MFKLHIDGDFKSAIKLMKSGTVNPALATVRVDMVDIRNPKIVVTNGMFMSVSAIKVTDMNDQALTEAPHDWLVLPINLFAKVKPQATGKRNRRMAQYEIIIDAEKPMDNVQKPMIGTAEVIEDGVSTKFALADTGVGHTMIGRALKTEYDYQSSTEEQRKALLDKWNGSVRIIFDATLLQTMIDLQQAARAGIGNTCVLEIDVWSAMNHPDTHKPYHVLVGAFDSEGNANKNHGMLMPISGLSGGAKPQALNTEYAESLIALASSLS
jgi:hypothetical protein